MPAAPFMEIRPVAVIMVAGRVDRRAIAKPTAESENVQALAITAWSDPPGTRTCGWRQGQCACTDGY